MAVPFHGPAFSTPPDRSELKASDTPTNMITPALNTGSVRTHLVALVDLVMNLVAVTARMPIRIRTAASPMLKVRIKTRPKTILCIATAARSTTIAEGHGTIPPEMPSVSRLHNVTSPRGT